MTLHSALEDLRATTLGAISGTLRKLEYLAGLRGPRGTYSHWGLARIHGELAASKALEEEHHSLISTVLGTPIQSLLQDVEAASQIEQISPVQYVAKLKEEPGLLPPNPGAGSAQHLSSVLDALLSLLRHRRGANRPVS
jgi:hypothetical protein